MLPPGKPGRLALMSPTASPPVKYGRKRSKLKPTRPRAVASHFVAGLATRRAQHGGGAFDARPVDVALGSDDGLAELPVVTDGAADEAAREVERIHGVPLGTAPAAAAVDAEIKPGPGIDRIVGRSRLVIGRQIGGPGRSPRQRQ